MRRTNRRQLGFGATASFPSLAAPAPEVRGQNTFTEVPFNQGSLFDRPGGAKPPRTTLSSRTAPSAFRPAPRYVDPQAATTYGYDPQPARRR